MKIKNMKFSKNCLLVILTHKGIVKSKTYFYEEWGSEINAIKAAINYRDNMKIVFKNAKQNGLTLLW